MLRNLSWPDSGDIFLSKNQNNPPLLLR
ncbi:hypothetical protein BGLA2_220005 [Burkholderia gladioli]|nr:hypothetical protein BGLA2_220005 [Burkholderia gladioli]